MSAIFEDWNPAEHVVEPFDVPDDWPRFLSTDYPDGPVMLWAKSPDGVLYLLGQDANRQPNGALND